MDLSGLIAYCSALAIAAIIPGPQIVAIVAQSLRSGYRLAGWMTAGMVLGDIVYLAAALAGLAYIAETFTTLLIVIKWAGVAYLSWLAVQFWRADPTAGSIPAAHESGRSAFMSGILITLGNPKSVLFYVSILPTVIDVSRVSMADALLLAAVTGIILSIAQYPFALAGARARHALSSPRAVKLMNRGAAVCMGGTATAIATRQ
ncbi:LysE family translocator [Rhizobium azibense]|uniref:Threonine/homoserine/homoserine lactone efflux protein n=1 Tax=Rhizobium azibense TaxID=1136135 RepID=A0A4R3S406_9HYPH|nr:LysE family translocator [Rhizobium azibense]TCU41442.1 threonine/homoserine/homoserine lactone efflux protein [Rhizobium azibense]